MELLHFSLKAHFAAKNLHDIQGKEAGLREELTISMDKEEIRKYLKPITDGLFGKQRKPLYERPHFQIRDLNEMLRDLTAIPDVNWYGYAFSREPLNGKFTDEQRRDWMEKSIACGRQYAHKMMDEYGTSDSAEMARKMGMVVTYPQFPDKTDRVMFAEFREPNNIKIFMDAVDKAEDLLQDPETAQILTPKLHVSKLLLAHELFHYVEEQYKNEIFTRQEKIRLWKVGPVHNDSEVIALSEIAAMAFAQEVNDLPYSPYVLDTFLVYGYSPEEASGLYEEMMDYSRRA